MTVRDLQLSRALWTYRHKSKIVKLWRAYWSLPLDSKVFGLVVIIAALTLFFRHTVPFIQYEVLNR